MKIYKDYATGSGKVVQRCFCGECGKYVPRASLHTLTPLYPYIPHPSPLSHNTNSRSPIMSLPEILPDKVIVKMGMFPRIPQPECENFAAHRQEWQGRHEGLVQFGLARGGKKLGE
jgi:hypothetical protein